MLPEPLADKLDKVGLFQLIEHVLAEAPHKVLGADPGDLNSPEEVTDLDRRRAPDTATIVANRTAISGALIQISRSSTDGIARTSSSNATPVRPLHQSPSRPYIRTNR